MQMPDRQSGGKTPSKADFIEDGIRFLFGLGFLDQRNSQIVDWDSMKLCKFLDGHQLMLQFSVMLLHSL